MKNVCLLLCLLAASWTVHAQRPSIKKANQLFAQKSYVEAAKMYQTLGQSQEVLQNLADSYYYNSEMKLARTPYTGLFTHYKDSLKPEVYFRYAQALKGVKDYAKADEIMGEYLGFAVDTEKFITNLSQLVPYNYEIQIMTQSSRTGDFGIAYYGDKVVFSSYRNRENPIFSWNKQPYLDLYQAEVTKDKKLVNIQPFSEDINTKTHESNATFTKDGKTMYFSRTSENRVHIGEELVATVKLYRAELVNDVWTHITELPFSSDHYSTQHPVLNPENTRLYFSSDMPGTIGSFDIFYVDIIQPFEGYVDESYSEPVNLGKTINTAHREQFPFVGAEGTLYFASDGHQGMGGLDLFVSKFYNNAYSKPLNLGATINSEMDDFGYVLKEDDDTGYFASNRMGHDNLYAFTRTENERQFTVEGYVQDKVSKDLLPGTTVTLFDENDVLVDQMVVGEDAQYIFNTQPNKDYSIEAHRNFYIPTTEQFTTNDDGNITFNIELSIESYDDAEDIVVTKDDGYIYIELENIYFDFGKYDIKPEAERILDILVYLLNKYPRMEIQLGAHTDNRSSDLFNLHLSHNRAAATLEYLVENGIDRKRLRSKGYGKHVPLVDCGDDCTEAEHSINRRCEFLILK
ncbi:OmpA family protein [Gelidibacter maritimus]|uniref:OmpA family protein n=1 Tax=Gelidibacter maritimus TaxID=2761487 RepID=A0A7W2M427_9FLAO|nr:OmpA family protein [Gelidibacter maritimus]MBA6152326.1 OmpA family protein [Gelidibacter maritimus]